MPIQPIDLQILFSQMNQVGKDVAHQKEAALLSQSIQGGELVKETHHKDESVNQTKQVEDEVAKVRDDEKHKERKQQEPKGGEHREEKKKKVFQDPDLGTHIDISG
jgi:hypothetical protein